MTEQIEHDMSNMVFDADQDPEAKRAVRRNYRADGPGRPPPTRTSASGNSRHALANLPNPLILAQRPSASQHNPRIAADSPRPSSACPMPSPLSLSLPSAPASLSNAT